MTEESSVQVIENSGTGMEVFEAQERAAIDTQIVTAKKFPRELHRVKNNCVAAVSMDIETAQSCRYAKPVAGKNVTGPSVHLARIIAQQYGNIRVQQRIKQITDRTIIAEAVALDMETNYAVSVEARRSIIGRTGQRYTDSLIETNAMGILAIAERNAILKIVPKGLIDVVYKSAFKTANGDLDDEQKLLTARKKAFDFFAEKYDATEQNVLDILGLRSSGQVTAEHIADLRGYMQALKDGELTADELFGKKPKINFDEKPKAKTVEPEKEKETKTTTKKKPGRPPKPETDSKMF